MRRSVIVYSDNERKIDFNHSLGFFNLLINPLREKRKSADLIILDYTDWLSCQGLADDIRLEFPGKPILIIVEDATSCPGRDKVITHIRGYGAVTILDTRGDFENKLLEAAENLMGACMGRRNERLAIVLPLFNESGRIENVRRFYYRLRLFLLDSYPEAAVYFIDDGSSDNTVDLMEKIIGKGDRNMNLIRNEGVFSTQSLLQNTRKAGTYIQGLREIDADILVFVDSDDSFEIEDLGKMLNIIREGYYDMVIGSKDKSAEGRSPVRRLMSFAKRLLTRPFLPEGVTDSQTGLKVFRSTVAWRILPYLHEKMGLALDLEIMYLVRRERFRVYQMPVVCYDKDGSHVQIIRDSVNYLKSLLIIPWLNRNTRRQELR